MLESPLFALLFFLLAILTRGLLYALDATGRTRILETIQEMRTPTIVRNCLYPLFTNVRQELTHLLLDLAILTFRFLFFLFAHIFFLALLKGYSSFAQASLFIFVALPVIISFDLLIATIAAKNPNLYFRIIAPLLTLLLLPFWPIAWISLACLKRFAKEEPSQENTSFRMKDRLLELLNDTEFSAYFDPNDQKLLLSVLSFKQRIVREVMVPRIDISALPIHTTIREAAQSFIHERYSRVPIYRDSIDQILGALYYKDLLNVYAEENRDTSQSIEKLIKPIVYAPETKKISHLLQEFRSKQIHLAIVIDEYGGTEGIVTIEDILEELVGEIADEYDVGEEALFTPLPTGGWIVDAKMNILDIEEELGVRIPPSAEYDTIGGYLFHKAGAIPSKGFRLHHDDFDLEVLSSSERSIEKIRITPHVF